MPLAPSGELTSVMIGRETTFGSAVVTTTALICDTASFLGSNQFLERPGARQRIGRTEPVTGMFMGKGSLSFEVDPDTIGAVLKLLMGAESIAPAYVAPTNVPGAPTGTGGTFPATGNYRWKVVFKNATVIATGTNAAAYAAVITGISAESAQANVTATTQNVTLTLGAAPSGSTVMDIYRTAAAGASGSEMLIASNVAASTTYTDTGLANGTVALPSDVYTHTFTLASPRSSFTAQFNRVADALNAVGNKISQLSMSVNSKAILMAKLATEYASEAYVGSPVAPSYSTLYPFSFETPGNFGKINGVNSTATIQAWNFDVNTALTTDFPAFGNGRYRGQMPEGATKAAGGMELAFETTDMVKNFWGSPTATGPQSIVLPIALDYKLVSTDLANVNNPFALEVIMGKAKLTANDVAQNQGNYLKQMAKFELYETANGASDDIKFILTNQAPGSSI